MSRDEANVPPRILPGCPQHAEERPQAVRCSRHPLPEAVGGHGASSTIHAGEARGPAGQERRHETRGSTQAQSPRGRPHGDVMGRPAPTTSPPSRHREAAQRPLREATGPGGGEPSRPAQPPTGPWNRPGHSRPRAGGRCRALGAAGRGTQRPRPSACAPHLTLQLVPPEASQQTQALRTGEPTSRGRPSRRREAGQRRIRGVPSVRHTR